MKLPNGAKFDNHLDCGLFWLHRVSFDKLEDIDVLKILFREYYVIDYSNHEIIKVAVNHALGMFLEHYKTVHRFDSIVTELILEDLNPFSFRNSGFGYDPLPKNITEYGEKLLNKILGYFTITACREDGLELIEYEMDKDAFINLIESKREDYLEKKRQMILKEELQQKLIEKRKKQPVEKNNMGRD